MDYGWVFFSYSQRPEIKLLPNLKPCPKKQISNVLNLFSNLGRPTFQVRHEPNGKKVEKTTRVRTVLNEKQLHTLRTCYAANPRPDAMMKEQLVEMTGLSPRVIRVWFQNKRCKDKKKSIQMKQQQGSRGVSSPDDQVGNQGIDMY